MSGQLSLKIYNSETILIEVKIDKEANKEFITIPEDIPFEIIITAPISWGDISIEIGDIKIKYEVNRGEIFNSFHIARHRYVENHFGQCSLKLYFSRAKEWYEPLAFNVLAKKANALQAEAILKHLSTHSDDILRFCFSKAQSGSDHKESEYQDPALILQQAENIINFIAKNRGYLLNHYRSRLVSRSKISPRDEKTNIDDSTIGWLFQNLDQLSASDRLDFDVSINGWKYRLSNIHHSPLTEDTDVFENRVILSLLFSIKERLTKYRRDAVVVSLSDQDPISGYISFQHLLSKILPITGFWKNKCDELISETNTLIMFIKKSIPCEFMHDLRPTVTPFVRGNQVYRQIFNLAHQWYKLGIPSWTGQEYLASLLSLPKLYEFFCLSEILNELFNRKFIFSKKDYRSFLEYKDIDGISLDRPPSNPYNYYSLSKDNVSVELFYEPKIWSFKDYSDHQRLIDISHAENGKWAFRSPDFLFKIVSGSATPKYLIFDAKYSTPKSIIEIRLPDLINKYLLGLGVVDAKRKIIHQAPMIGVFSLHPNPSSEESGISSVLTPNHLNDRFGPIKHVVLPAIASIELAPLRKSEFGQVFEKMIELSNGA